MRFKMYTDRSCALALSLGFVILLSLTAAHGKKGDQNRYKTTYACEGNTLNITCKEGVIHLRRANYGRFSISVCNDHGNLEWRVNCMSVHSFPIMQERCTLKTNCSINVSSSTFQDPCPGTRKYLEVQYHCAPETSVITSQVTTPSPAVKLASGSNTTSSLPDEWTPMFTPPSSSNHNASQSTKMPSVLRTSRPTTTTKLMPIQTAPAVGPTKLPSVGDTTVRTHSVGAAKDHHELIPTKSSTVSTTTIYSSDLYCPSVVARGINWTWTKAGDTAVVKCPDGASGHADWHCSFDTVQWTPEEPNLHQCRSLWLENLKRRMEDDSIISTTTELALMSNAKPLFSSDLKEIGDVIQQVLYKGVSSMENVLGMYHRYQVLKELLQSLVQTLSNLLDDKQKPTWNDLKAVERKNVISSLLVSLEESALLLAETSSSDGSFSLVKDNVLFALKIFSITETQVKFPATDDVNADTDGIYWTAMQDQILLPAKTLEEYSHHGVVKVVFTAFRNIDELLNPGANILDYPQDQSTENVTWIVNSRIISASLERTRNPRLHHPVIITLKHLYEENTTNPICVFWDFHSSDWSARGCWVEMSNRTHTICACDHLTNFAVIMEQKNTMVSSSELEVLNVMMTAGCIVAIICLLITAIVLCTLRSNSGSVIIQKNMFICLVISEMIFVAGIDQTSHHITCAIIAGALQYFFLASFSWMFFECYQQYVTIISSGDPEKSQTRYYYVVSYTLPAIIVGVSAVIDPSSYGTKEYCWLHADNYFVFSFVGPAVGIIFGGIVFLCITMCIFWHHTSLSTAIKGKEEAKLADIKSLSGRTLTVIIVVVLTWTAGLLYINKGSVFLAYTFSILNCILGIIVLALYCLRNEKVVQEYKNVLTNQSVFTSCLHSTSKEEESQNAVPAGPNRSTSADHISQQYWTAGMGKISGSKKSLVQGHLSTLAVKNIDCERVSDDSNTDTRPKTKNWDAMSSGNWRRQNSSSGESITHEKDIMKLPADYQGYRSHRQYRHFSAVHDPNNQFVDHIYESIDDDESIQHNLKDKSLVCPQFPPAENYYGDHSDLSQHSSSSYGYDQRPLIGGIGIRHTDSPQAHSISESYSDSQELEPNVTRNEENYDCDDQFHVHSNTLHQGNCSIFKLPYGIDPASIIHGASPNYTVKNYNTESMGPTLPDLLQCPNDSSVVLAVLEGDKVVSQLQQEDFQTPQQPKHKLSTYC